MCKRPVLYKLIFIFRFVLGPDVDLKAVVAQCPLALTGADFYALCSDALLCSMKDKIANLETTGSNDIQHSSDNFITENQPEAGDFFVCQEHFLLALDRLTPSVSEDELKYYRKVQAQFTQK